MHPGKAAFVVVALVALLTWLSKWKQSLQHQTPQRFTDRIQTNVKAIAAGLVAGYSANQNPIVTLLKLTEQDAQLTQLRHLLTDEELANITQLDVSALSHALKTEQNKAFQRVVYFLPPRLGHDGYNEWYFPQQSAPQPAQQLPPPPTRSQIPQTPTTSNQHPPNRRRSLPVPSTRATTTKNKAKNNNTILSPSSCHSSSSSSSSPSSASPSPTNTNNNST